MLYFISVSLISAASEKKTPPPRDMRDEGLTGTGNGILAYKIKQGGGSINRAKWSTGV
jgi:hypothetical protein